MESFIDLSRIAIRGETDPTKVWRLPTAPFSDYDPACVAPNHYRLESVARPPTGIQVACRSPRRTRIMSPIRFDELHNVRPSTGARARLEARSRRQRFASESAVAVR